MDSGLCGKYLGMCCSWKKVLLSAVSFWLCSTECDTFRHFSFILTSHLGYPWALQQHLQLFHKPTVNILTILRRNQDTRWFCLWNGLGMSCLRKTWPCFLPFLALLNHKRCVVCPAGVSVTGGLCLGFCPEFLLSKYRPL